MHCDRNRWTLAAAMTVGFALAGPLLAEPRIETALRFSLDGGKTYQKDFPLIAAPQEIWVRVDWQILGEARDIKDEIVLLTLHGDRDFASANRGLQDGRYTQRSSPYWFGIRARQAEYRLNLDERPEGIMGSGNQWDVEARTFKDAPLPACPALSAGVHRFTFRLYYHVVETHERVETEPTFLVTIDPHAPSTPPQEPSTPAAAAESSADLEAAPLPPVEGLHVFTTDDLELFAGSETVRREGAFVRPRPDQDLGWRIHGMEAGSYYLRLQVESGHQHGTEQLSPLPFLYCNGLPVPFNRAGVIAPHGSTHVTILQSAEPVPLREGDQIRWNRTRTGLLGGLALARDPMDIAPVWVRPFFDPDLHDVFRIQSVWSASGDAAARFELTVHNVKNATDRFRIDVRILDYFQNELAAISEEPELADQQTFPAILSIKTGASDRYRAVVSVRDSAGNRRDQVLERLENDRESFRRKMWLNDGWEWTSIPDDGTMGSRTSPSPGQPPTNAQWIPVDLPASWKCVHPDHHVAVYRRRFTVPSFLSDGRLFLHIARLSFDGRIHLNGQFIGEHMGPGPIVLDVSGNLRLGEENELWIGLRDEIGALEPEELRRESLVLGGRMSRWRAPAGLHAGLGEIWLTRAGSEAIEDVFIRTSHQERKIDVDVRLPQFTGLRVLSQRVLFKGEEVLRFEDRTLERGGTTVTLGQAWEAPILWGPETFHLLQLVTELRDGEGVLRDRLDTRFGFREFAPDGRFLSWNGTRVKFASLPFQSTWSSYQLTRRAKRPNIRDVMLLARRMDTKMLRHIYDPGTFAEIADEEGIVFAQGLAGINGPSQQKVESDTFWGNTAEFARQLITGLRNHPSIITWYLSNEFHGQDTLSNQLRLQELGRQAQPHDPTRILEFGCDIDLGGFSPVISTHYPVDLSGLRNPRAWLPHAALWRDPDKPFEPGQNVPSGQVLHVANVRGESVIPWGFKPIIVNETCWNVFFSPPDGLSRILPEAVYESEVAVEAAHKIANRIFARGHRDAEVSAITLWEHMIRDPNRSSIPALEIHPIHRYGACFGGSELSYSLNLHRDRFNAASAVFAWQLVLEGQTVAGNRQDLLFEPCELKRMQISLTLPVVAEKTVYRLNMILEDEFGEKAQEEIRVVAFPAANPPPSSLTIGLYDPEGQTAEVLTSFLGRERLLLLKHLDREVLDGLDLLILGRNATIDPAFRDEALRHVKAGGRILALHRDQPLDIFPVRLNPTTLNTATGLTFHPGHPWLQGIDPEDLSNWLPDHRIGSGFYLKPHNGNYRVVIESSGPNGLVYAGLIEFPVGRGSFIASQIDLVENLDRNPVAGLLWCNLLRSIVKPELQAFAPAGFIGPAGSPLRAAWTRLGVRLEDLSVPTDKITFQTVVLDAALPLKPDMLETLRSFVDAGGGLLVGGLSPANAATATAILGAEVCLHPVSPPHWHGRAVRCRDDPLLAGLTHYDLYWKERPTTENYAQSFYSPQESYAPLGSWMLASPAGRELLYPAFWLRANIGMGFVLFDTLNWTAAFSGSDIYLGRLASTLFTNLGVEVGVPGRVVVPEGLVYVPLDLSGIMNREFEDDVGEDGKGGWTDQGPDSDLRDFRHEAGVHDFDGIPFRIDRPRGCLVLQSQYRPAGVPASAEIPVGRRADALFFLQTSAWTSDRHHASYAIRYADGTVHEIKLIGGVNYRDWAANDPQDPFLFETETMTSVAWTGKTGHFPKASIFRMAWPNPHPGKKIESIVFTSENRGVPVLVGITIGLRPDTGSHETVATADPDAAHRFMTQALGFLEEMRFAEAETAFRNSIAADPGRGEPHLRLGYLYESREDWNSAIAVYRELVRKHPEHIEGLFRMGKCHENLAEDAEAMAVYRRLLEINLNQPEVIEALSVVRKRVKATAP